MAKELPQLPGINFATYPFTRHLTNRADAKHGNGTSGPPPGEAQEHECRSVRRNRFLGMYGAGPGEVATSHVYNSTIEAEDFASDALILDSAWDLSALFPVEGRYYVYAVWTPVPEPGTGLLVMTGLLSLAGWRRRRV